jgi:hypothetical protein
MHTIVDFIISSHLFVNVPPSPLLTHTYKQFAGKEARPLAPSSIGVMGTFTAIGRPVSQAWSELATTAYDGDVHLIVQGVLNWSVGCEVVVTPTDLDPHEVRWCVRVCVCVCEHKHMNLRVYKP